QRDEEPVGTESGQKILVGLDGAVPVLALAQGIPQQIRGLGRDRAAREVGEDLPKRLDGFLYFLRTSHRRRPSRQRRFGSVSGRLVEQLGRGTILLLAHPKEAPDRRARQDGHRHPGDEPAHILLRLAGCLFDGIDKLCGIGWAKSGPASAPSPRGSCAHMYPATRRRDWRSSSRRNASSSICASGWRPPTPICCGQGV